MQAPSCIFTLLPIRILFTSPRTTALNQIEHSSPIITSPTTVELGAKKQDAGIVGVIPLTGSMIGIRIS
jgi:hypothetical protein